jgi:hypothetical protein
MSKPKKALHPPPKPTLRHPSWERCKRPLTTAAGSGDPFTNETRILPSSQMLIGTTAAGEQVWAGPSDPQIIIQRLSCDLGQLKPHRPPRFPLPDGRSVERIPVGSHIGKRKEYASGSGDDRKSPATRHARARADANSSIAMGIIPRVRRS